MTHRRTRLVALALLSLLATPAPAQGESADERYGFLVGLCDEREWQLAVREARAFLEEFPGHAKADLARYRLASALFETGDRAAARDAYAQLERREGFEFRAEVSFRRGQCELGLGRPAEAATAFERVLTLPAGYLTTAARFFLAESRFALEDYVAAEQAYQRVLAASDAREYERGARYGLCWCSVRLARHEEAVKRIDDFLRRHPQDESATELRYLAGEAHLASGRAREADAAFSAVRQGPYALRALRGSAFAAAALEDHATAARRFAELAERAPEGEYAAEARLQRGIHLLLGGDARGAAEALRTSSADPEGAYWLARALLAGGDAAAALSTLETVRSERASAQLLEKLNVLRGDALTALGRAKDAAEAYRSAGGDYALHAAAIAAFNGADLDAAGRLARELLERFPESTYASEMWLLIGEAALARKELAVAQEAFAKSDVNGALEATRSRAALRRAWALLLDDEAKAAAEQAAALRKRFPQSAEAIEAAFVLGRASEKLGDSAAATRAWREYVQGAPQGPHAAEALAGLARVDKDNAPQWTERLVEAHGDQEIAFGALLELAEADAREGRGEQAIARLRQLLERWPVHVRAAEARYSLAWRLHEAKDFAGAAQELRTLQATEGVPEDVARAAAELAVWVASGAGDAPAVIAAYRRLAPLGLEPRRLLAAARIAAAELQRTGQAAEASAWFDELLARARGDRGLQAEVLLESAWIALDGKETDEAEARLRTAWKLGPAPEAQPALAEACFFAGEQRFAAGELERAQSLYELALPHATAKVAPQVLYKLGFVHLRAERLDEAAGAFTRLTREHPTSELAGESRYLAAECRFRQGRYEECVLELTSFTRDLPRHACVPKALLKLGIALGELGRWKECEAALAELARRGSPQEGAAEADLWRARAIAARGDDRGARAAYEKVLSADRGALAARARIGLGLLDSAQKRHEDALAQFLKVALLYEDSELVAEAGFLAGRELESLERLDKARARYADVAEKHPKSEFARLARERLAALPR